MNLEIREENLGTLEEHARIPISFRVDRVFDVSPVDAGLMGLALTERPLSEPYIKDYDHGEAPRHWAERFDTSNWGLLSAYRRDRRIGGAVIAFDTPDLWMLGPGRDGALLWDLRVHPEERASGVGTALFGAVERWARARGCRWLKVETQNINVPACRFYARQGCVLGAVDRFSYRLPPKEVQLVWFKRLD